jgi:hypothetical protein
MAANSKSLLDCYSGGAAVRRPLPIRFGTYKEQMPDREALPLQ